MDLVIKDSIIIMDEAHNIESFCQDEVGYSVTLDELNRKLFNFS
mgnify:CR=1 FL=1